MKKIVQQLEEGEQKEEIQQEKNAIEKRSITLIEYMNIGVGKPTMARSYKWYGKVVNCG